MKENATRNPKGGFSLCSKLFMAEKLKADDGLSLRMMCESKEMPWDQKVVVVFVENVAFLPNCHLKKEKCCIYKIRTKSTQTGPVCFSYKQS